MSVVRPPTLYVVGAMALALVGLLGVTPAVSRPPTADERLVACGDRVKELEAEVQALREQLRLQSEASALVGAPTSCTAETVAPSTVARRSKPDVCNPPFDFDHRGMKYYKPECLHSDKLPSCAIPFQFSSSGIKSVKPDCLDSTLPPVPCDPPYGFDNGGLKIFKRECL